MRLPAWAEDRLGHFADVGAGMLIVHHPFPLQVLPKVVWIQNATQDVFKVIARVEARVGNVDQSRLRSLPLGQHIANQPCQFVAQGYRAACSWPFNDDTKAQKEVQPGQLLGEHDT